MSFLTLLVLTSVHIIVLAMLLSPCSRMRFKRKTNDVKAIHATLKELQGIDPLDYLAKYET